MGGDDLKVSKDHTLVGFQHQYKDQKLSEYGELSTLQELALMIIKFLSKHSEYAMNTFGEFVADAKDSEDPEVLKMAEAIRAVLPQKEVEKAVEPKKTEESTAPVPEKKMTGAERRAAHLKNLEGLKERAEEQLKTVPDTNNPEFVSLRAMIKEQIKTYEAEIKKTKTSKIYDHD